MKKIVLNILQRKYWSYLTFMVLLCLTLFACSTTKKINQKTTFNYTHQKKQETNNDSTRIPAFTQELSYDNHEEISLKTEIKIPVILNAVDSLTQIVEIITENEILSSTILEEKLVEIKSLVAEKIVSNYLNSENKEPGGHCLTVSKERFETAYKEVYGHWVYKDLPEKMRTKYYTAKEVFDFLYVSASGTHKGWHSLPKKYRGKGSAGAIAYAGMGTLIDESAIWGGALRPGALMQVWRYSVDYEKVVRGTDVKKLDPYGHSFIFISYVRDEENKIIGLKIANQGFQGYRPLVPRDYEVWWAVNLSV